jgi:hypothetical protein
MRTLELNPESWREYFHSIGSNKVLATVQLLTEERGPEAEGPTCQPLRAIGYDPYQDMLELAVGGETAGGPAVRYFVSDPRRITVTESNGTRAILVDDASGAQTFIGLFDLSRLTHRQWRTR